MTRKGISLVEILAATAIFLILAVIAVNTLSLFRKNSDLNFSAERVVSLLTEARAKTLASRDASQYGVHFESSRMVLFRGASFTDGNPSNDEFLFPGTIELSSILLNGGGGNVLFSRLTGETSQYGTLTLRLRQDFSQTKMIDIKTTGITVVVEQ